MVSQPWCINNKILQYQDKIDKINVFIFGNYNLPNTTIYYFKTSFEKKKNCTRRSLNIET